MGHSKAVTAACCCCVVMAQVIVRIMRVLGIHAVGAVRQQARPGALVPQPTSSRLPHCH